MMILFVYTGYLGTSIVVVMCLCCGVSSFLHLQCVSILRVIGGKNQSLSLSLSPQFTIPHQWMEGNLPAGSKCCVCDRTCGSVRRLQDFRCLWCKLTVSPFIVGLHHWDIMRPLIFDRCTQSARRRWKQCVPSESSASLFSLPPHSSAQMPSGTECGR